MAAATSPPDMTAVPLPLQLQAAAVHHASLHAGHADMLLVNAVRTACRG